MNKQEKKQFINAQYIYSIKRKRIKYKKRVCNICKNQCENEYVEVKLYDKHNRTNVRVPLCIDHGREIRI